MLTRHDEPEQDVERLVERGADMAEVAIADGLDAAIARFHAQPPGVRAAARRARREEAEQTEEGA